MCIFFYNISFFMILIEVLLEDIEKFRVSLKEYDKYLYVII